MNLPAEVKIREVAPRDGFQSLPDFLPTKDKTAVIEAVVGAGVKEVEATSFVSPVAIPQLRDAGLLMEGLLRTGVTFSAVVPNLVGAKNALKAGADQLVVVISASEPHNLANVKRSVDRSLSDLDVIFEKAEESKTPVVGAVAVSFGCPFQGEVPEADLFRIIDAYLTRGAASILLGDTTGMALPNGVERLVGNFRDRFGDIELSCHFHNNRGTAMANLLSALIAGATTFDTALGGIGGCPNVPLAAGNLPTEDVVYMLEGMGVHTGIDLPSIIRAAQLLEKILGQTLPGQVMKSGPRFAPGICRESFSSV